MDCPKCGQKSLLGDECPACGIFVSKYLAIQARKTTCEQESKGKAADNTTQSYSQPISPSTEYPGAGLPQYLIKHKKIIIAILLLIFTVTIILLIKQIVNLMTHASIYTRIGIMFGMLAGLKMLADRWIFKKQRERRRTYYRDDYLKSDDWKRKRSLVLKRDNHRCVFCGALATQVHHKNYAPQNIGREPIEWLVSVCDACHSRQHGK